MASAPLFRKVLIANRGEIALRVIRACRELGIQTVAVYSTADEHSLHVKLADEAVCIGPPHSKLSYLNMAAVISAADITEADAIHPGYGFLSENAEFARLCAECKITFIGPTTANIRAMGEKTRARAIAREAGVPMLPGTLEAVPGVDAALEEAEKIGYPVILKAAAGGGGRGIYVVYNAQQLKGSFDRVSAEAGAAFGNPAMYVEKYCEHPRHVEIQVLCDKHGNRISLGERQILPADTRILKRNYLRGDGLQLSATVVVSGKSRLSIHRPEMCLPGQGFNIQSSQVRELDLGGGRHLREVHAASGGQRRGGQHPGQVGAGSHRQGDRAGGPRGAAQDALNGSVRYRRPSSVSSPAPAPSRLVKCASLFQRPVNQA